MFDSGVFGSKSALIEATNVTVLSRMTGDVLGAGDHLLLRHMNRRVVAALEHK